jgi:hypothetical protein
MQDEYEKLIERLMLEKVELMSHVTAKEKYIGQLQKELDDYHSKQISVAG